MADEKTYHKVSIYVETACEILKRCLTKAGIEDKRGMPHKLWEALDKKGFIIDESTLRNRVVEIKRCIKVKSKHNDSYPEIGFYDSNLNILIEYAEFQDYEAYNKQFGPANKEFGVQNYLPNTKKDNLPPCFKEHITRTEILQQISECLESGEYPATALWGLPGMGKSMLAFDYARTYQHLKYPGGCWYIRASGDDLEFKQKIIDIAETVWNFKFTDEEQKDEKLKWRRVKNLLEGSLHYNEKHLTLLIFDNVDKPGESFSDPKIDADRLSGVHILITAREMDSDSQRIKWIPDSGLLYTESLEVLKCYRQMDTHEEEKAAAEIVRRLDGMAMALTLVGVQLRTNIRARFADALEDLKVNGIGFLDDTGKNLKDMPGHYPQKVITLLFLPILKKLEEEELGAELLRVLDYSALMPADQVALPWIKELVKAEFPDSFPKPRYKSWAGPWQKMIGKLKSLSLITETSIQEVVRIHRLLQDVINNYAERETLLKECNDELIAFAGELAESLIGSAHIHSLKWNIDVLLALAIENITKDDANSIFLNRMSLIVQSLGDYSLARSLIKKAIAMDEKDYPPDHPRLGILYSNMGMVEFHLGNFLAARGLMKKAIDINEKSYD